jgi:hypothetical protein
MEWKKGTNANSTLRKLSSGMALVATTQEPNPMVSNNWYRENIELTKRFEVQLAFTHETKCWPPVPLFTVEAKYCFEFQVKEEYVSEDFLELLRQHIGTEAITVARRGEGKYAARPLSIPNESEWNKLHQGKTEHTLSLTECDVVVKRVRLCPACQGLQFGKKGGGFHEVTRCPLVAAVNEKRQTLKPISVADSSLTIPTEGRLIDRKELNEALEKQKASFTEMIKSLTARVETLEKAAKNKVSILD